METSIDKSPAVKNAPATPRGLWLGITLTIVGSIWLLWNFEFIDGFWVERYGILLIGLVLIVRTIYTKTYRFFSGVFLAGIGGFHIFLDYQPFDAMRDLWPVYFLVMGAAFLIDYAANFRRWISLVFGLLASSVGGIWLGRELFYLDDEWITLTRFYWPLLFIVSGCIMVAVTLIRRKRM